jgi:hypothetical protein
LGEDTLFRIGNAYQQATDWHLARPCLEHRPYAIQENLTAEIAENAEVS